MRLEDFIYYFGEILLTFEDKFIHENYTYV